MLRFSGVGVSDVGRVRDQNEDSAFLGPYLALVADGVGGAAAGEVASATATHVVSSHVMGQRLDDIPDTFRRAVEAARDHIVAGVDADPRRAGMATTLTAVATNGRDVVMAHVGDSRAYRLTDGKLSQVSTDHTYVQQLVDHGRLDDEGARQHPWSNVVLRSLSSTRGTASDASGGEGEVDITHIEVRPGDRMLICSDGLSDLIARDVIADVLGHDDPRTAASRLLACALEAGGKDNVTCLVFDVIDGRWVIGDGQLLGAVRDPANIVTRTTATGTLPA
ncbi:MAG: protein phosphatase 2C domain-containing protein [Nocardioides sp.]|nr:protein phosphatase 2C domain-containing protein [Nocardioides sp.]